MLHVPSQKEQNKKGSKDSMIYIKVADFQAAKIEDINLTLSMNSFCKELYDLFTIYYTQFAFDVDWNNIDSMYFENEVIDLRTYEDMKQDLLNFQTLIFDRQTWVILLPVGKRGKELDTKTDLL